MPAAASLRFALGWNQLYARYLLGGIQLPLCSGAHMRRGGRSKRRIDLKHLHNDIVDAGLVHAAAHARSRWNPTAVMMLAQIPVPRPTLRVPKLQRPSQWRPHLDLK